MKNIIYLIVLVSSFSCCFGQTTNEFKETQDYYVTEIDSLTMKKYFENFPTSMNDTILIYLKNYSNQNLFEFSLTGVDLEFYSGAMVEVLDVENLKNINQIIQLTTTYDACCSNHYSYYFLKNENGKLIQLPEIDNMHCDGPEPKFEYRFPNQEFGVENKILFTKSFLNDKYEVDSVDIQKRYTWNGKVFELEK